MNLRSRLMPVKHIRKKPDVESKDNVRVKGILTLCPELITAIVSYLSPTDLMAWRNVNRVTRAAMNALFYYRIWVVLREFVTDEDTLERILVERHAFFTGWHSLYVLLGIGTAEQIATQTLDFICTFLDLPIILHQFTQHEHYVRVNHRLHPGHTGPYYIQEGDGTLVCRLMKGDHFVNIVSVTGGTALGPLPMFWSTVLMNAISPTHIYCLYPTLTLRECGLVTPTFANSKKPTDSDRSGILLQQYSHEGLVITDHLIREDRANVLGHDPVPRVARPEFLRCVHDKHTLHASISQSPCPASDGLGSTFANKTVAWRLGGIQREPGDAVTRNKKPLFKYTFRSHPVL